MCASTTVAGKASDTGKCRGAGVEADSQRLFLYHRLTLADSLGSSGVELIYVCIGSATFRYSGAETLKPVAFALWGTASLALMILILILTHCRPSALTYLRA